MIRAQYGAKGKTLKWWVFRTIRRSTFSAMPRYVNHPLQGDVLPVYGEFEQRYIGSEKVLFSYVKLLVNLKTIRAFHTHMKAHFSDMGLVFTNDP